MEWTKIELTTTTAAVDLVSALFDELGLEGIAIEDHVPLSEEDKKAMFIDILPELKEDDGVAVVSSYMSPKEDAERVVEGILEGLEELRRFIDVGEGAVRVSQVDDKDWKDNWKQYFKPFYVTEHIGIKPTWETWEESKEGDLVLSIDPGTAFGTGSHETTRLCIQSLSEREIAGKNVLDVGCGSGILSIAALKLGAAYAFLADIDPEAVRVAAENMKVNELPLEQYQIQQGDLIAEKAFGEKAGFHFYDIVVANILADVIIPLSRVAGRFMKPDAIFISSGIINTKQDEVRAALEENGFEILETKTMKDWVSFTAKLRSQAVEQMKF